jgi:hypothetical protein
VAHDVVKPSEQTWTRLWWAAQLPSQRGILAPKRTLALLVVAAMSPQGARLQASICTSISIWTVSHAWLTLFSARKLRTEKDSLNTTLRVPDSSC